MSDNRPELFVMSIRRKASVMREDLLREPARHTQAQRCEEIIRLCEMLEASLGEQL